jgi:Leucine Rich repeat
MAHHTPPTTYSLLVLDGTHESSDLVKSLNGLCEVILETGSCDKSGIALEQVDVDEEIANSIVDLFRAFTSVIMDQQRLPLQLDSATSKQQSIDKNNNGNGSADNDENATSFSQTMGQLVVRDCPPNPFLEYILETALGMDIFRDIQLEGRDTSDDDDDDVNANPAEDAPEAVVEHNDDDVQDDNAESNRGDDDDADDDDDVNGGEDDAQNQADDENNSNPSSHALQLASHGFRMKFTRRLRNLELVNLPLSHDDVQGLMYGMENPRHRGIVKLSLDGVKFFDTEDDESNDVVIEELCDGLPNATSLRTLELERCQLTDEHLSKLFESLESHNSLICVNVAGNHCRHLGLKSIDRLLSVASDSNDNTKDGENVNQCRLEAINLGFQFTSENSFAMTSEQMQLDILTEDWKSKININLLHLNLSGNSLHDSDMAHVGLLLSRFPCLQSLDLSFNEITIDGLTLFAKTVKAGEKSQLRSIKLTNNPLTSESYASVLLQLLKILPELRSVQSNVDWGDDGDNNVEDGDEGKQSTEKVREAVQHLIDVNSAGRVLLCNSRRAIGLNIWPLVLARLTRPSKVYVPGYVPMKNKCNGIYYLLRNGPVLTKPNAASDRPNTTVTKKTLSRKRKRADPALGDYATLSDFLRAEADVST